MGLAISTAWNSFRYASARGFLSEIKKLGFNALELGFNLTYAMVSETEESVAKGQFEVVSVHNFCPVPDGLAREEVLPDHYSMSTLDEDQRRKAVKFTKITIETASRLKAKVVVLHCGRVEMDDGTRMLASLLEQGLKDTREYIALKDEILRERNRLCQPYFENTLRSLEELSGFAKEKNVLLGIENRFYLREIPAFEEIRTILDNFKGSVYYWHDTGHAQVLENLGFAKHKEYLDSFSDDMIGVHLHDCIATLDHKAPSKGKIDFAMLFPYVRKETLKVIEAHYPSTAQELKQSKLFLESIFDGKL